MTSSIPIIKEWEVFESFCLDIYKKEWKDSNAQKNGRSGQVQAGVDVFGSVNNFGVQCKKKDVLADNKLTVKEIEREVEKAKGFIPSLKKFIIAYTGQRDVKLQEKARQITDDNKVRGLFSVHVVAWPDLEELVLNRYPELLKEYYPVIHASFTGNSKEETDVDIIADIISETKKVNIKKTVFNMTGINNPAYMFCKKAEVPILDKFEIWINSNRKFENDFSSSYDFDLYESFISAFKAIYAFKNEYGEIEPRENKDYLVLGYATNPKWSNYGNQEAYSEKLKKAEKLGQDFDLALDALSNRWKELKKINN